MTIEIGDYVKVINENRAFKVFGFTKNRMHVPDGWIVDGIGCAVNPKFCEKYNGALSAINEAAEDIDCGYKVK